jgi:fatty acid desaturase
MATNRTLAAFGIAGIAIGIAVWAATGSPAIGIAVVLVGIGILVVPALRVQRPDDPEEALDNDRAERHRREDETHAVAENVEDRPPPTGA